MTEGTSASYAWMKKVPGRGPPLSSFHWQTSCHCPLLTRAWVPPWVRKAQGQQTRWHLKYVLALAFSFGSIGEGEQERADCASHVPGPSRVIDSVLPNALGAASPIHRGGRGWGDEGCCPGSPTKVGMVPKFKHRFATSTFAVFLLHLSFFVLFCLMFVCLLIWTCSALLDFFQRKLANALGHWVAKSLIWKLVLSGNHWKGCHIYPSRIQPLSTSFLMVSVKNLEGGLELWTHRAEDPGPGCGQSVDMTGRSPGETWRDKSLKKPMTGLPGY